MKVEWDLKSFREKFGEFQSLSGTVRYVAGACRTSRLSFLGYGSDYKFGGVTISEKNVVNYGPGPLSGNPDPKSATFSIDISERKVEWMVFDIYEACIMKNNGSWDTNSYIWLENLVIK